MEAQIYTIYACRCCNFLCECECKGVCCRAVQNIKYLEDIIWIQSNPINGNYIWPILDYKTILTPKHRRLQGYYLSIKREIIYIENVDILLAKRGQLLNASYVDEHATTKMANFERK